MLALSQLHKGGGDMADISQPAPVGSVMPRDKHGQQRKRRDEGKEHRPEAASSRDVSDVTDVMGIPVAEVTPKVQKTLNDIMVELDKTRTDLEHARAQVAYLEELADRHSVFPLINRRGLHRELSRTLALAARSEVTSSFICFHFPDMEEIRSTHGREATEAMLKILAETLIAEVRNSDVVGSLGGGDFGVILTIADDESATDKAASLAQALRAQNAGSGASTRVTFGIHTFSDEDSADSVLQAADEDLLRRG